MVRITTGLFLNMTENVLIMTGFVLNRTWFDDDNDDDNDWNSMAYVTVLTVSRSYINECIALEAIII